MGIVKSTKSNELGETVSAKVMKGNRQVVTKHVNDLILLVKGQSSQEEMSSPAGEESDTQIIRAQPPRKSKDKAIQKLTEYDDL